MIRNIEGTIVYQRHTSYVILDRINPQIISERMQRAGYRSVFAELVAYKGGMQTTKDAIEIGKRCGMLTTGSNTLTEKIEATQQRIQDEIQKYIDRKLNR